MPEENDTDNVTGFAQKAENLIEKNSSYLYCILPQTLVNDFFSEYKEMLGYFLSDDKASYKAYLSRIKLRVKQLRRNEEIRIF